MSVGQRLKQTNWPLFYCLLSYKVRIYIIYLLAYYSKQESKSNSTNELNLKMDRDFVGLCCLTLYEKLAQQGHYNLSD